MIRKFLARVGLAIATVLPVRPTPATGEPVGPAPVVDRKSYLDFEIHVGAHQRATRAPTRDEVAEAWKLAEAYWGEHYRGLPEELDAVTRRHRGA